MLFWSLRTDSGLFSLRGEAKILAILIKFLNHNLYEQIEWVTEITAWFQDAIVIWKRLQIWHFLISELYSSDAFIN